jgi:hypothetical protein
MGTDEGSSVDNRDRRGLCRHCFHPIHYHHLEGDKCNRKDCLCPGYEPTRAIEKKWMIAKAVMERARRALPPPTSTHREQFERAISHFHHYISHNELGLAFEELCAAAELVNCRGGVWRDLERAAEVMGLHDRVPYLRARFLAAPIGGR